MYTHSNDNHMDKDVCLSRSGENYEGQGVCELTSSISAQTKLVFLIDTPALLSLPSCRLIREVDRGESRVTHLNLNPANL